MNPGLVVKLRPSGPWRIGPDSGARNRVDVIYHSDSLYSAVTAAMSRLGWLEEWLDATARTATPAVSFSSCFPFLGDMAFVVPPRTVWPPASSSTKAARIRWKSARFVPLTVVQSILSGRRLDENQWGVDGPSDCLVPTGKPGPFRTAVRSNAGVDRLTGAAERHSTACLEFRADSGLWTVVSFADEAAHGHWSAKVKAAFRLLADTGFGGERSRGWGRSEAPEFIDGMLPDLILPTTAESAAAEVEPEVAEAAVVAASPIVPLVVEREVSNSPEPESPIAVSEVPAAEAAPPATEPQKPAVEPETPAVLPSRDREGAGTGTSHSPEPELPVAESEAPAVEAAPPEALADGAAAPVDEPETPATEAVARVTEIETPATEVAAPVADEPAALATEVAADAAAPEPTAPEAAAVVAEPAAPASEAVARVTETETPATEVAAPVVEPAAPATEVAADAAAPEPTAPETAAPVGEPAPPATGSELATDAALQSRDREGAGSPEPEPEPQPVHAGAPTHPHWLLSLFTPAPADSVDWHRGNYIVLPRGGRIDSPVASGDLKKQIPMVAEGSVLYAETTPRGSAADVAPDGFAHPVFRAGFAVAIPLPEVR